MKVEELRDILNDLDLRYVDGSYGQHIYLDDYGASIRILLDELKVAGYFLGGECSIGDDDVLYIISEVGTSKIELHWRFRSHEHGGPYVCYRMSEDPSKVHFYDKLTSVCSFKVRPSDWDDILQE